MLCKNLHIPGSYYRMLPNPTPYHWDKKFFSLRKLFLEFKKNITDSDLTPYTRHLGELINHAERIQAVLKEGQDNFIPFVDNLHAALGWCDDYLRRGISRELFKMVLREHFQEVLKMINDDDDRESEHATEDGDETDAESTGTIRAPRFEDIISASPEQRQEKFMEIYFTIVMPRVKLQAIYSLKRRKTTRYAPSHHSRDASAGSVREPAQAATQAPPPTNVGESGSSIPLLQVQATADGRRGREDTTTQGEQGRHVSEPSFRALRIQDTDALDEPAQDVWCTLVFRMLCWLLLHDFHKKDVQTPKSELLGSRLPVYIA
jgi:hypothetical protein